MRDIQRHTYHRAFSVTGPKSVLVSIRFGSPGSRGIAVVFRAALEALAAPSHDIQRYISEVIDGVRIANEERGTKLEICEIEIVPNDSPSEGMVRQCARQLAIAAIDDPCVWSGPRKLSRFEREF